MMPVLLSSEEQRECAKPGLDFSPLVAQTASALFTLAANGYDSLSGPNSLAQRPRICPECPDLRLTADRPRLE